MRSLYEKWMYSWETKLTTRDTNRVVRPLEWGIEWTRAWPTVNGSYPAEPKQLAENSAAAESYFEQANDAIIANSERFFGYETPKDFRLERRLPELYPTNHRQREQQEKLHRLANEG